MKTSKDIAGCVFGNLTAIRLLGKDKNRNAMWELRCGCGVIVNRILGELNRSIKKGIKTSCMVCSQTANRALDIGESTWNLYYRSYKRGAENRKLLFDLSISSFKNLCTQKCHYCQSPPRKYSRYANHNDGKIRKWKGVSDFTAQRSWIDCNGIDRKNSSIGYIEGNILPCCTTCNMMKGKLDYKAFISKCSKIHSTLKETP